MEELEHALHHFRPDMGSRDRLEWKAHHDNAAATVFWVDLDGRPSRDVRVRVICHIHAADLGRDDVRRIDVVNMFLVGELFLVAESKGQPVKAGYMVSTRVIVHILRAQSFPAKLAAALLFIEVEGNVAAAREQVSALRDELFDKFLLGRIERVVGRRFFAEDLDRGLVVGEFDRAANDRLIARAIHVC